MRLHQLLNLVILISMACLVFMMTGMLTLVQAADHTSQQRDIPEDATKVYWPMLRGESVQDLAKTLYPDSPILRKRFIDKTRSMSHAILPNLDVNKPFAHAQMVVIPNERAVRELTHKIKRYQDVQPEKKPDQTQQLNFSYTLDNPPPVPAVVYKKDNIAKNKAPAALPEVNMPEVKAPETKAPTIKVPEIKVPEMKMPDIKVPEVNMPNIETDTIKTALSNFWYRLSTGFQNLTSKTGALITQASSDARVLLGRYKGKNIQAIMNDYHLRNIALLALLFVMAIGLLIFSKRHSKQHAQSLDDLSDTIRPVEEQQGKQEIETEKPADVLDRKEPTIEIDQISRQPVEEKLDPIIELNTAESVESQPVISAKETLEDNQDIPTLSEALDVILAEESIGLAEQKPAEAEKPEIPQLAVEEEDKESKTVNIVVDSAKQLKEIVDTDDSGPFIGEVSINSVPSRKK